MLMAHHNGAPPDHHGAHRQVDDDDADILFAPSLAMEDDDDQHKTPAYTRYVAGLRESAAHLHAFLASHIHDAGAPRELAVAARTLAAVDLLIDSLADLAPRLADLHDEQEMVEEQQRAVDDDGGDHHWAAVDHDDTATNGVYSEYEHQDDHDEDDDDVHAVYATANRDDDNGNYHYDDDHDASFAAAYDDPAAPPAVAPAAPTLTEHDDDATDRIPHPAATLSTHEPAVPDAHDEHAPTTPPPHVLAPVPLAATPPGSSVTRHFASLYRTASTRSAATGSNTLATSLDAVDFYAGYAADNPPPAVPPIPEAEEPAAPVAAGTGRSPMRALIGKLDALHEEFQRYVHGSTPPASPAQNATVATTGPGPKLPPRSSLPRALGNANGESGGVMRSGTSEEDDEDDDFQSVLSSPAGSVTNIPAPTTTVPTTNPSASAPIHVDDIDDDIDDVPCHFHTESLRRTTTSPPPPGIDLPAAVPHNKKRMEPVAESIIDDSPTPRPSTSVHPAPTAAPHATTPAPAPAAAVPGAYHRTAEHRRPAPARPSPTHTPSPAPATPAAPAPAPAAPAPPTPAPAPTPAPQPSTTLSTAVTAPAYRPRATMADLAADAAADAAAARAAVAEHDRRIAAAMQRARHSSLPATTSPAGGDHESGSGSGSSLGAGVPIPRAHLLADTPPAARLARGALEEAAAVIASHMPPDVVQEHQRRKAQDKQVRGRAMSEPDVGRGARRAASAHDDENAQQHVEEQGGEHGQQQPRRASASALKRGTSPGPKGRVAFAEEVAVVTPIIPASKKRSNPLGALKKMIFSRSSSSSSSPPAPTNAVPRPSSPSASGDKYPGRAAAAAAAMAMLTRSESQLSRHIHEAEANMEQNMRVIATVGAEVAAREQWEAQLVAQLGHEQAAAVIAAARAAHEQQMEMARPVTPRPDLLQPPPPSGLPTAVQVPSSLSSDAEEEDDDEEDEDEEESRASSPSVDGPPRHHHQPAATAAASKPASSPSPKPADPPATPSTTPAAAADAPKVTAAAAASRAILAAAGNTVAPLHRGPSTHLVAPDHAASALVRTNTRTRASTKVVTLDPAATPSETASLVASGALHASLTRQVSQRVLPPAAEASAAVPPDTTAGGADPAPEPEAAAATPSAASAESEDDDYDEAELWPLVELPAPGSDGGIRKRAASVLRHVAVDAVGYYSANEPDERRAHARAFQAAFLARRASPAVAALHRALMRVSVARLVAALDPRRAMEGGATDPLAPEDVLRAFVAGFADDPAGLCGGSLPVLLATDGRAAAQPVPQGLAGRLVPPNDLAAARARFTPPHPVVNRLLDRLAAVLALARLAGLALLFPAPGARFVREYMANAAPALPPVALLDGGDDPAAQHRQLAAELQEAASSLADAGAHRPPLGLDEDDDDGEDDDETVLGASMPRVKVVVALVFPGLLDAHGAVLAKAQVVAQ
ncbi:hypothetical protein GGF32_001778 [Allomyces javanicus]|nr:hypothetical protein GGF32_001778 [Allomyces javanicus]